MNAWGRVWLVGAIVLSVVALHLERHWPLAVGPAVGLLALGLVDALWCA